MSESEKRILLAGATGYVGRAVVTKLLEAGFYVVAPVRASGTDIPGCDTVTVADAEALAARFSGERFDAVFSCMASRTGAPKDAWRVDHDANQHLLDVAKQCGAAHFVLLSAICVQKPRLAFQHAKLAFERALIGSGMRYSIVRPTAFFKSLSGQIDRVKAGKPFLVFGNGDLTACKPIGERDIADFLVECLSDTNKHNRILPIGGPGPALTAREQGELLFELAGKSAQFRSIPPALFRVFAAFLAPLAPLVPALAAKAEFARIGHYYATESMLLWDEDRQCYDADATPSTGAMTLRDHYRRVLREGMQGQEAGDHKLF